MRRLLVSMILALLAVGGARAQEVVNLRLDWATIGYHAPFYLARDRGYYAAAGLDVKIHEGKGSGNTITLVANGSDQFGYADAAVAARAIGTGVPIKVVMGIIRKSPASIALPGNSTIKSAADLKGRTVLSCAGHAALVFLPAFLKTAGLQMSDIGLTTVDCGSVFPLLAQGRADAATGFTPGSISNLARAGMTETRHLDYASVGIILPSHGIVAHTSTIEKNPAMVRKFVQATARGWKEALANVDAAIENLIKARPLVAGSEEVFKTELRAYGEYVDTPGTAGKPFGWQSPEEWKAAEQLMVTYMEVKPQASVTNYFTNEFVE